MKISREQFFCDPHVEEFVDWLSAKTECIAVNLDIKKSTDLFISGKEIWRDVDKLFFTALANSLNEFKNEIDFFKGSFLIILIIA